MNNFWRTHIHVLLTARATWVKWNWTDGLDSQNRFCGNDNIIKIIGLSPNFFECQSINCVYEHSRSERTQLFWWRSHDTSHQMDQVFPVIFNLTHVTRSRVNIVATESKQYHSKNWVKLIPVSDIRSWPTHESRLIFNEYLMIHMSYRLLTAAWGRGWGKPCVDQYSTMHFIRAAYQLFGKYVVFIHGKNEWKHAKRTILITRHGGHNGLDGTVAIASHVSLTFRS